MEARSARADELHHLADAPPDPAWSETFGLDFASAEGEIGGYVVVTLRPSEGRAWFWACVTGAGRVVVAVDEPDVPLPRRTALELRASGLWVDVECETPFDHISLGLEAFGVAFEHPLEAVTSRRGERTPVGFDLEWETTGEIWRPEPARYAMRCRTSGEVLVGDERFELDGDGQRWHRWGGEPWWHTATGAAPARGDVRGEAFVAVPDSSFVLRSSLRVTDGAAARWHHEVAPRAG